MSNKPIEMIKIKQIIEFYLKGTGTRTIVLYTGASRNTIKTYIKRYQELDIPWEELKVYDDQTLFNILTNQIPRPNTAKDQRIIDLEREFPQIVKDLNKTGWTLQKAWERYKEKYPNGFQHTQFGERVRKYLQVKNGSMHIEYKSGDKMLVDYAGDKLFVTDLQTGELMPVEVFVAILGSSQCIYVQAVKSQSTQDFLLGTGAAFNYFGGVTKAIVTDNLKAAVLKSSKFEPRLNPQFELFCEHYGTSALPARAYKPKDKALVEGAVKLCYQRIYAAIRGNVYASIEELNQDILKHLAVLNSGPFKGAESRFIRLGEMDKLDLSPLPATPYEYMESKSCTVSKSGFVYHSEDKNYYSVPFNFIGNKVKMMYNSVRVEITSQYETIAMHQRNYKRNAYTYLREHLASHHQAATEQNPETFKEKARAISPGLEQLIIKVLESKGHPEVGYKVCNGMINLARRLKDPQRIENACRRALEYGSYTLYSLQNILERGLDQHPPDFEEEKKVGVTPRHSNIRGKNYYQ